MFWPRQAHQLSKTVSHSSAARRESPAPAQHRGHQRCQTSQAVTRLGPTSDIFPPPTPGNGLEAFSYSEKSFYSQYLCPSLVATTKITPKPVATNPNPLKTWRNVLEDGPAPRRHPRWQSCLSNLHTKGFVAPRWHQGK